MITNFTISNGDVEYQSVYLCMKHVCGKRSRARPKAARFVLQKVAVRRSRSKGLEVWSIFCAGTCQTMPLELHIWGPAFGLPSIDAECLAAIAYLRHSLGNDEWVLVASCDPSVSPTRELPALKSGSLWVSRYRNIVDYLRKCSSGRSDLDRGLDKLQKADSTAYASNSFSQLQQTK